MERDSVRVEVGKGDRCFVCEEPTPTGKRVLSVSFDVPIFLATIKVKRDMHVECAKDLRALLDLKIKQATVGEA